MTALLPAPREQFSPLNVTASRSRKCSKRLALAADGVHLLDSTWGRSYYVEPAGFHRLLELVSALKETTGLPIMVSPGVLSAEQLVRLREAGADWYACYQETHKSDLFTRLRLEQDYDRRKRTRLEAAGPCRRGRPAHGRSESAEDLADSRFSIWRVNR